MSFQRIVLLVIGICIALVALATEVHAQSVQNLIYGKVYTANNAYQGVLRWGSEEIMWTDHFNATKPQKNLYKNARPDKEDNTNSWLDLDWRLSSIWENKYTTFQFVCQFGDLRQIIIRDDDDVFVTFKNGVEMELNGGSNDLGATINVYDDELGNIKVDWDKIRKIEFMPTPAGTNIGDTPLYGTVATMRKGSFTGYVAWDNDERMGKDKLDGKSRDGSMSIAFRDISRLQKKFDGCEVTLKSGRDFFLTGTNDVNDENRGIFVSVEGVGTVEIPWREFDELTLTAPPQKAPDYGSFPVPAMLSGNVNAHSNQTWSGKIVYDMDETWDFEMLEGKDDEVKFSIPFRNIKRIKPKNFDYSQVELRNGVLLLLGGVRDVNEDNDGLLIFRKSQEKPDYIDWRKVNEIIFD